MKSKIIILVSLISISSIFSQKTIVAENYGKKFDGELFGILRKDGFALVDTLGNITADKIKLKQYDSNFSSFEFYKGITYQYDDTQKLYRLIDKSKKPITEFIFKEIKPFITDNTWAITKEDKEVFIDTKGNIICDFNEKKINQQLGLTDLTYNLKVFGGLGSKKIDMFYGGLKRYINPKTNQIGFINKKNQIVIKPDYYKASNYSNGLISVCKLQGNKYLWGFINTKNQIEIPFKFSNKPGDFKHERALFFSKNRKYGYINKKGEVVIEPKFYNATDFYKGFALVKENYNSKATLIDSSGNLLNSFGGEIEVKVNNTNLISLVDEKLTIAILKTNFKKNIINKRQVIIDINNNVISKRFDEIFNLKNKKAFAINRDIKGITEKGLINSKGNFIVKIVESEF